MKSERREKFGKGEVLAFAAVLFAMLAFVTVGYTSGTPHEESWNNTFGGAGGDRARAVEQTIDGGYILAGFTVSYGAGGSDFWLVKTDSNGNERWNKTFGGIDSDMAKSAQQTSDGGYILAGYTSSYGAGGPDFWLVKTDPSSNKEWDKTFGGTDFDFANSVQQTTDCGYILAGDTQSYGAGLCDFWLVKTDSSGNKEWDKTFGGTGYDRAYSVQQTADGGYIVAGSTESYGAGGPDFWLVKTDSFGNKQWDKTFGGIYSDVAYAVQQTTDGGYILAGHTCSHGAGWCDFWLVKTDSNGNKEWNKTFGGVDYDMAYTVQQTADDGYILAGSTKSYGAGGYDVWLVKTDLDGNEEWDKTFGGTSYDEAHSVQQTADGGYIVVGETESYGAGSYDFWLIKVKGVEPSISIFDTEPSENPYPSIMGTHNGTITPSRNISVSRLYTYTCVGTSGHTESIKLYENGEPIAIGTWSGYQDDWHNITIAPSVTLLAGHTYNYTIITGSYPQIIHEPSKDVTGGTITCTSFVDANGKIYTDWIPAIRLHDLQN